MSISVFNAIFTAISLLLISCDNIYNRVDKSILLPQDDEGRTMLMSAVLLNDISEVRACLKMDIDFNQRDNDGRTALMLAIINDRREIVDLLFRVSNWHQPDNSGYDAVHYAQTNNFTDIVQELEELEREFSFDGFDPIELIVTSILTGNLLLFRRCLDSGVNIDRWSDEKGRTLLMLAIEYGRHRMANILFGMSDFDLLDHNSWDISMYTARYGFTNLFMELLDSDDTLALNHQDVKGRSSLMIAAKYGSMDIGRAIINVLQRNGEAVNLVDYKGRTALMIVISYANHFLAEELVPISNLNIQDINGETALMYMIKDSPEDSVEMIDSILTTHIDRVDLNIRNKYGKSALDIAFIVDRVEVAEQIIREITRQINPTEEL